MSKKLKPFSCRECPLYEQDVYVPGGFTNNKAIIMSDCPPNFGGHFSGRGEMLVKELIKSLALDEVALGMPGDLVNLSKCVQYMYCTNCHSESLKKSEIEYCRDTQILNKISKIEPEVILCLGKDVALFFGLGKVRQDDLRGQVVDYRLPSGKSTKLVFSISIKQLLGNPGLHSLLVGDIKRAAQSLKSSLTKPVDIESLRGGFDIATDLSDIKDIAKEYSSYKTTKPISQTLMSLDTETNTLFPWWDQARIISFSAGFGGGKSCSFLVDHKEAAFSLEDVLPYLLKITLSKHPKAWWNYKYDLQMFMSLFRTTNFTKGLINDIEWETGMLFGDIVKCNGIHNTRYDGILGEHLLDENKKGWYSLKSVIADYKYELYGYESTLDKEKDKIRSEREIEVEEELKSKPIGDICEETLSFSKDVMYSDVRDHYESKKQSLKRKLKRAKNTLNENLATITERKMDRLQSEYKILKKNLSEGEKLLKKAYDVKKPTRAGLPTLFTYEDLPVDLLLLYGAIDADGTCDICIEQRRKLHKENMEGANPYKNTTLSLMDRHCLPVTEVLAVIQSEGVFVDTRKITEYKEALTKEITEVRDVILSKLSDDFPFADATSINLNSNNSIGNVLVGWYGLPILAETPTGLAAFTEEVMVQYAKEYKNPMALLINKYKKLTKARDTYVLGIEDLSAYDSRLHGSIHLNGAATGRSSSSNPNLQNIPEKILNYTIKSMIRCTPIESPTWELPGISRDYYMSKYGWVESDRLIMVDADLSGAEVKIMTCFAPDKELIKALNDGLDAHSWLTSEVHGIPYEDINTKRKLNTPEGRRLDSLRGSTKALVFKILYGGEPEDKALKQLVFDRFPGIPEYLERAKTEVYDNLKVYTPNGRCRRFPMVRLADWAARRMYRQAINFGIQSYCSDVVFNMLVNLSNTMHEIRGRILLTVHDSVVFECPESELGNLQGYLQKNITEHIKIAFPDIPVPMPFGFKVGYNYGEMYSVKDWHKYRTK